MLKKLFFKRLRDERGATAIEYGLIAALISIAILVSLGPVGNALKNIFNEIEKKVSEAAQQAQDNAGS